MSERFTAVIILLMVLTACAGVRVIQYRDPYPPTQTVEVFRFKAPDRDYEEIAELEVQYDAQSERKLEEEARKLGADAVIIVGDAELWKSTGQFGMGRDVSRLTAIAVKYKDREGGRQRP